MRSYRDGTFIALAPEPMHSAAADVRPLAPASAQPVLPSRKRWLATLLLGAALWLLAVGVAHVLPQVAFGLRLQGWPYGVVGLIQALLAPIAIALSLRLVGLRLRDVGLVTAHWRSDALIGAAVAVAFAALQFLVIIPNTGGAERSDVAMNAAQLGDSPWGVIGFVVLAWTGGFSEELFFRGHLVASLRGLLRETRSAPILILLLVSVVFALMHGYQGWSGMVDTGLYGGVVLTLLLLWRQRLTACIVAHAMWNTLAVAGIYLWY